MKSQIVLLMGLALASSAQTVSTVANLSQEPSIRFRTNGVFVVDHIADGKTNKITYQEIVTEQAPVQVIKILVGDYTPIATNRISLTQSFATKPLLSAQRPPPRVAPAPAVKPPKTPPTLSGADTLELKTKIPATHVPSPPPSNSMAYINWVMRNNVTNALPPNVPTNSPIFRRFSEWKKTAK